MRRFVCMRAWVCVSQCGRGSLLTWLTHLPWLTNIKRASHINLLSTDSDVDWTQRVPRPSMVIDLQTEVQTKQRCLGKSRLKEHHAVHCTSTYSMKQWNTQLNYIFSVWVLILHLMLGKKIFSICQERTPRNFRPFKSKYSSAGCMSYNRSAELCWRSSFVRLLVEWGSSKVHNECVCMFNESSERGSWILVIWVRMRLAACHGRSSLITYALAHN